MDIEAGIREAFERFAAGHFDESAERARTVLQAAPDEPRAYRVLAGVAFQAGQLEEAEAAARRAAELDPTVPETWANLAAILNASHRPADAEEVARKAVELAPDFASAWINVGLALKNQARSRESVSVFRRAIQLRPGDAAVLSNLGNALSETGDYDGAVQACHDALQRQPGLAEATNNLGNALLKLGQTEQAITAYRQTIKTKPELLEAAFNLGTALERSGQLSEAETVLEEVLVKAPGNDRAANNLGVVLKMQGRLDDAGVAFEKARQSNPDSWVAHTNQLSTMHCEPRHALEEIRTAHEEWSREHVAKLSPDESRFPVRQETGAALRVGFLSPDFGRHPVGYFLLGTFEALDHRRLEPVCFSDREQPDDFTSRFRSAASGWHDLRGRCDAEVAELVVSERIDVLVDLTGHTGRHRLGVMARRPAALQLTWIGYPGTTGLATIDGIVADDVLIPKGAEKGYTEEVLRLPGGHVSYLPPPVAPEVIDRPKEAPVVFGSFNKLEKTNPDVLTAWAELLDRCPLSTLVMGSRGLEDPAVAGRYRDILEAAGVDGDRIELRGWVAHDELLETYARIDIALDTFPFSGGLTSCEALWMGVPVVTWAGDRMSARQTAAFLLQVDLAKLVTGSREEYIEAAAALAEDRTSRCELRGVLRERMRSGSLCHSSALAENFTGLVERAWQQRCVV